MAGHSKKLEPVSYWPVTSPAQAGASLLGPPLPSWWPRPGKRIVLDTPGRRSSVEPWHRIGLGPEKLTLQIATRWG